MRPKNKIPWPLGGLDGPQRILLETVLLGSIDGLDKRRQISERR